jgi:hypothetical protein
LKNPYVIVTAAAVIPMVAPHSHAKVFMTQPEALQKAFQPPATFERHSVFLDDTQAARVEQQANAKLDSRIFSYYIGQNADGRIGTAIFDTTIVRSMPVTYMVVIQPSGEIQYVEILAFHEPDDYLPRSEWMALYKGKSRQDQLRLRHDIPNVTGASLTAQALSSGIRKLLAVYQTGIAGARP